MRIMFSLSCAALCSIGLASGLVPAWSVVPLMGMMGFGVGFIGPSRDMLVRRAATLLSVRVRSDASGFVYWGSMRRLALAPMVFGPFADSRPVCGGIVGRGTLQILAAGTALAVGSRAHALAPRSLAGEALLT